MRNPFEVLGLPDNAPDAQVKEAYRSLARKIQEDPNEKNVSQKMKELDEAYDAIILMRGTSGGSFGGNSSYGSYNAYGTGGAYAGNTDFSDIRDKIRNGRIDDAETLLDGVPASMRTAEWHFLKGTVQYRKGWLEEASSNYSKACAMDPNNREYQAAYNNMKSSSSGGFRTERQSRTKRGSDCSPCDICMGLCCADSCCECMGGDLISCC
ncbi:MAG: DnaJ domain-containing protein [Clostridiales bacterium]|nr:DnaJ domain-containing protein [Clostridiales bacterium]